MLRSSLLRPLEATSRPGRSLGGVLLLRWATLTAGPPTASGRRAGTARILGRPRPSFPPLDFQSDLHPPCSRLPTFSRRCFPRISLAPLILASASGGPRLTEKPHSYHRSWQSIMRLPGDGEIEVTVQEVRDVLPGRGRCELRSVTGLSGVGGSQGGGRQTGGEIL